MKFHCSLRMPIYQSRCHGLLVRAVNLNTEAIHVACGHYSTHLLWAMYLQIEWVSRILLQYNMAYGKGYSTIWPMAKCIQLWPLKVCLYSHHIMLWYYVYTWVARKAESAKVASLEKLKRFPHSLVLCKFLTLYQNDWQPTSLFCLINTDTQCVFSSDIYLISKLKKNISDHWQNT